MELLHRAHQAHDAQASSPKEVPGLTGARR